MYNVQPPMFPDTISDEYGVYTSVKVDGFSGLQIRNGMYGDISSNEISDGVVHFHWDDPDDLPEIQSHDELKHQCGISAVHIHSDFAEGLPSFGIEFGCSWENEHGAGVSFIGLKLVESGHADISFYKP